MTRILLAGGTGVIGRRLLPLLTGAGHDVTAISRVPERRRWVEEAGATLVEADAFDAARLRAVAVRAGPEVVVHQLTALPPALDPRRLDEQLAENDRLLVEGTRNLVAATVAAGAGRLVAQSIAYAYAPGGSPVKGEDDPLHLDAPYPWRRSVEAVASLERQVQEAPLAGVVLRYGYFYGPGTPYDEGGALRAAVERRRFPIVGSGAGIFSFVHVDDAAQAAVLALERGDGVYNVVDDEPAPLRAWLPAYAAAIGAPSPRRVPVLAARAVAGAHAVYLATEQPGASNAKARRQLGFAPRYPSWRDGFAADRSP